MATDTNNPFTDVQTIWPTTWDDPNAFWTQATQLVVTKNYSDEDALAFLFAASKQCDQFFSGPSEMPSLPPSVGGSQLGPMTSYCQWCARLFIIVAWQGLSQVQTQPKQVVNLPALCFGCFTKPYYDDNDQIIPMRLDAQIAIMLTVLGWWCTDIQPYPSPIPPLPGQSSNGNALQIVESAANAVGLLAFAVPVVGPVAGAILQAGSAILHIFFPGVNQTQQQTQIIDANVEMDFVDNDIKNAKSKLDTRAGDLQTLFNDLAMPPVSKMDPDDLVTWLQNNVLVPMPGRLDEIQDQLNTLISATNMNVPGVVEVLAYGVTVLLATLRQQVVTDVTMANYQQQKFPDDLDACTSSIATAMANFETFQMAVNGVSMQSGLSQSNNDNWAYKLNKYLFQAAGGRLVQISIANAKINDKGSPKGTTKTSMTYHTASGDNTEGQIFDILTQFGQDLLLPYVTSVGQQLDAAYASHFSCISGWIASIAEWTSYLPTLQPQTAPLFKDWTAQVPQGEVWQTGTQVRYAICYANEHGTSQPSPWSDAITVANQAKPILLLTPDSTGIASCFWILRQIMEPGAADWNGSVCVDAPNMPPPVPNGSGGTSPAAPFPWTDADVSTLGTPAALSKASMASPPLIKSQKAAAN